MPRNYSTVIQFFQILILTEKYRNQKVVEILGATLYLRSNSKLDLYTYKIWSHIWHQQRILFNFIGHNTMKK